MSKAYEFIEVKFSFNGNLGLLQTRTQDNINFANCLRIAKLISREEWEIVVTEIQQYFIRQFENVDVLEKFIY